MVTDDDKIKPTEQSSSNKTNRDWKVLWKRYKKIIEKWINSTYPQIVLAILLLLSLFMADAW